MENSKIRESNSGVNSHRWNRIQLLPREMKMKILSCTQYEDKYQVATVCREWFSLVLLQCTVISAGYVPLFEKLVEFYNLHYNTRHKWPFLLAYIKSPVALDLMQYTAEILEAVATHCRGIRELILRPQKKQLQWSKLADACTGLTFFAWLGGKKERDAELQDLVLMLRRCKRLEHVSLDCTKLGYYWKNAFPRSLKELYISFKWANLKQHEFSPSYVCEDTANMVELSIKCPSRYLSPTMDIPSNLSYVSLRLNGPQDVKTALWRSVLRSCTVLESIELIDLYIDASWANVLPLTVKAMYLLSISVDEALRDNFSLAFLCKGTPCIRLLSTSDINWGSLNPVVFKAPQSLTTLNLGLFQTGVPLEEKDWHKNVSLLCRNFIKKSNLVSVHICGQILDEHWILIFPPTVKSVKLCDLRYQSNTPNTFKISHMFSKPSTVEDLTVNASEQIRCSSATFQSMESLKKLCIRVNCSADSANLITSAMVDCVALENFTYTFGKSYKGKRTLYSLIDVKTDRPSSSIKNLSMSNGCAKAEDISSRFTALQTLRLSDWTFQCSIREMLYAFDYMDSIAIDGSFQDDFSYETRHIRFPYAILAFDETRNYFIMLSKRPQAIVEVLLRDKALMSTVGFHRIYVKGIQAKDYLIEEDIELSEDLNSFKEDISNFLKTDSGDF